MYVYILSLSVCLSLCRCVCMHIYIYIYIESDFTLLFLFATKLSLNPAVYSLHVESYTRQSSNKRQKLQAQRP